MITISSHKPDGKLNRGPEKGFRYKSLEEANRCAEFAARKCPGSIFIVWENGAPQNSWSFPVLEGAAL